MCSSDLVHGAVLIRSVRICRNILVFRERIGKIGQLNRPTFRYLLFGTAANEHRLAQPFNRHLSTGLDATHIYTDCGKRAHVSRGVHLVDQWPNGCTNGHSTRPGCRVVEEIPPVAFEIISL